MEPNNEKIAIYAGTFDPPTKGHISIIKQLVEKGFLIWMVPITSPPPHKPNSNTISHRLEMCRESIDDLDINIKCKVKVLDVAINFSEGMSAYYLMNFLENNYPEKNMRFLIGSDILQHITQWDSPDMRYISDTWYTNINGKQYKSEGDAFVNEFKFIVMQRLPKDKYPLVIPKDDDGKPLHNFNIVSLDVESDISSTIVRNILTQNYKEEELNYLLSNNVLNYIKNNKLFM